MNELQRLIGKYVDDDDPRHALEVAAQQNYELMMAWPGGVPSGVMFAANVTGTERMMRLVVGMMMDVAKQVHGWTEDETALQEGLSYMTLQLIVADSMRETLTMTKPKEGDNDE